MKQKIYILIFLIIAIWPKFNIINVAGSSVGIRLEDFAIAGFVIYNIFKCIKTKEIPFKNINFKKLVIIFSVFMAASSISTVYGIFNNYIHPIVGFLFLIRKLEYFIFIFIGYEYALEEKNNISFQKVINFIVIFHFTFAILQICGLVGSVQHGEYINGLIQNRICTTFNGAYEMTAFLLLLLPIYLYNIFISKVSILENFIYVLMIGTCIFVSDSRTSQIIFLLLFLIVLFELKKEKIKKFILPFTMFVVILVTALFCFDLPSKIGMKRFETLSITQMVNATKVAWKYKNFDQYIATGNWFGDPYCKTINVDASFNMRMNHWMQLIDGFTRSPMIGLGTSVSTEAADGNYVRILCESGIFGLTLWIVIMYIIIKNSKWKEKYNFVARLSLYTLILGAIFIDVFEASKAMTMFWILLGIAYGYKQKKESEKNEIKNIENVIVINDFNYVQGGASKVAIQTAKLLSENNNLKVYFFSAVNKIEENIKGVEYITTNQNEALRYKNKIVGFVNGIYNIKAKYKLRNLLMSLDNKNTVVHVHGWTKALSSSIFDILFEMNFKVIVTLHDYFTACPNGGYFNYKESRICDLKPLSVKCLKCNCDSRNYGFKLYRILRSFVQNKIVCLNDKLEYAIGISDLNIEVLKKTLNKDVKLEKIYNPIEMEKNNEKVLVKNNEYYLFVGRLDKEKGIDVFCREISKIDNAKSIVVGDGSERKELEQKYKNIEFVGWKSEDEVKKYMKKARALIFPSLWYEAAPLTPLEAMKIGIPCIISNCCAATEYVDGKNGLIFDPYIECDLIIKIQELEKNISEYSDNAYDYMRKFKSRDYASELIAFYNK
jgi:glycosyltransferase involved in cell wall biosynthesis